MTIIPRPRLGVSVQCTYPHSIYNIIVDHFYPLVTTQSLIMIHKQRMSWITIRTASFCLQVAVTLRFGPGWAHGRMCEMFPEGSLGIKAACGILYSVHRYEGCFEQCSKLAICHVVSRRYWHLVTCHESHSVIFVTTPIFKHCKGPIWQYHWNYIINLLWK